MIVAIDAAFDAEPERRDEAVRTAAQVAGRAAEQIHCYGVDPPILRCAAACEGFAHRFASPHLDER